MVGDRDYGGDADAVDGDCDGVDSDGGGPHSMSLSAAVARYYPKLWCASPHWWWVGAAVEEELGWRDKKCVIGAINGNCVMMALLQTLPTASSHFGGGVMVSVPWF